MSISTSKGTYAVSHSIPTVATYRHLRLSGSLSDKSISATAAGLPNSLFCVNILQPSPTSSSDGRLDNDETNAPDPTVVGMGRVVGGGGCFYQIVDIVVLPAHQGRGLGKLILNELMAWVHKNVPETGYVSLIADGRAKELYAQFGFVETAPASVAMAMRVT